MGYINCKLNKNYATKYKDYYYQKSNDKYYIFNAEGIGVGIRFTIKHVRIKLIIIINNMIERGFYKY